MRASSSSPSKLRSSAHNAGGHHTDATSSMSSRSVPCCAQAAPPHWDKSVDDPAIVYRVMLKEQQHINDTLVHDREALKAEVRVLRHQLQQNVYHRLSPTPQRHPATSFLNHDMISCSVPGCHRHRATLSRTLSPRRSGSALRSDLGCRREKPDISSLDVKQERAIDGAADWCTLHQQDGQTDIGGTTRTRNEKSCETAMSLTFDMQTQTQSPLSPFSPKRRPPALDVGAARGIAFLGTSPDASHARRRAQQQAVPDTGTRHTDSSKGDLSVARGAVSPVPQHPQHSAVNAKKTAPEECNEGMRHTSAVALDNAATQEEVQRQSAAPLEHNVLSTTSRPAGGTVVQLCSEKTGYALLLRELLLYVTQDDVTIGHRNESSAAASSAVHSLTFPDAATTELYGQLRQHIYQLKRRVVRAVRDTTELEALVQSYQVKSHRAAASGHESALREMGEVMFHTHRQEDRKTDGAVSTQKSAPTSLRLSGSQDGAPRPASAYAHRRPVASEHARLLSSYVVSPPVVRQVEHQHGASGSARGDAAATYDGNLSHTDARSAVADASKQVLEEHKSAEPTYSTASPTYPLQSLRGAGHVSTYSTVARQRREVTSNMARASGSVDPLSIDQLCSSATMRSSDALTTGIKCGSGRNSLTSPYAAASLTHHVQPQRRSASHRSAAQIQMSESLGASEEGSRPATRNSIVAMQASDIDVSRCSTLRDDSELSRYLQWKTDFVSRLQREENEGEEDDANEERRDEEHGQQHVASSSNARRWQSSSSEQWRRIVGLPHVDDDIVNIMPRRSDSDSFVEQ